MKLWNKIILWAGTNTVFARYVSSKAYWNAYWANLKAENPHIERRSKFHIVK